MGKKFYRLNAPSFQNQTLAYGAVLVERVTLGVAPGALGKINLYDYDHLSGNVPAQANPNSDYRVIVLDVPTSGIPTSVEIGAYFHRGLTVRLSDPGLDIVIVTS